MSDVTIVFVVLGAVVVLFVWNRLPVELVAIGAALSLWATGVIEGDEVVAGFGDSTVVFIATLFVVSEALDATGITTWAGRQLIPRVGESRSRLLTSVVLLVAALTALISVNGAVAALLPMIVVLAIHLGRSPSLLLMPLAFGAHAGSMLALTGTPINVIVSEAADDATGDGFGYFEFTIVGVVLVAGAVAIMVYLAPRLVPDRHQGSAVAGRGDHALSLVEHFRLAEGVVRLRVGDRSGLVGRTHAAFDLAAYPGVILVGVRGPSGEPTDRLTIAAGDILLVRGEPEPLARFSADAQLTADEPATTGEVAETLLSRQVGVVELIVRPRSGLVGRRVFPGMLTDSGELVILAVHHANHLCTGEHELSAGDSLLVQGTWDALDVNTADPDVFVVDTPSQVRRQTVPLGPKSGRTIAVVTAMIGLLATGVVPAAIAGLLAASALILLGVVTVEAAYHAINWTVVILVGGMIPVSRAMEQTGAGQKLADLLVDIVGDSSPYLFVVGVFVLTAVFSQLISNTATALLVIPIAVSAATDLDVSPRPILMTITIAAAAAFLTPVATPANMMVMGPGGYRFGDYWKLGLPMMVLFLLTATFLVPAVWRF